jgi:Domain of unknown function (DUF4349)
VSNGLSAESLVPNHTGYRPTLQSTSLFKQFGETDSKGASADPASAPTNPGQAAAAGSERMMVYQGGLMLQVARPEEAIASFLAHVKQWGGYLGAQMDQRVTVRVPAAQFEEAMTFLRGLGRVLSESRQADDVTKQYVDLGIRLDNATKGRDRLLALLEKATKVEDVLAIERELRSLTEEIERMEGQLKYLKDQVQLATLTAEFTSVGTEPSGRAHEESRFDWIRRIGVQSMLEGF